jgi:hypothetical protein
MPYQRIVCFKFKAGASDKSIRFHMQSFSALKETIPQIVSYSGGLTTPEKPSDVPKFDSLHYLTFAAEADITQYHDHPAHLQFIKDNQAIWEDVLVLNAPIE